MLNIKRNMVLLFTVIIALVVVREGYLFERHALHLDESLSLSLSSYSNYGFSEPLKDGVYTGSKIREAMWSNKYTAIDTTIKLWLDNRDAPHSNLYYTLLQAWNRVPIHFNYSNIPLWSAQLNIAIYSISAIAVALLALFISKNSHIAIATVILSGLASQSISNSIFIRPYQLQELMFVIYTTMLFLSIKRNKNDFLFLSIFSIVTAFTALTGYFAIFYIALTFPFYVYMHHLNNGTYKSLTTSLYIIALSIIIAFATYPRYFFINNYRSKEAIGKMDSAYDNIVASISSLQIADKNFFLFYVVIVASIILAIIDVIKRKRIESVFVLYIFTASVIWCCIVMFLAPYKIARYIYPIIPIIALIYVYCISYIKKPYIGLFSFIICVMAAYNLHKNGNIEYLYTKTPEYCDTLKANDAVIHIKKYYKLGAISSCFMNNGNYLFTRDRKSTRLNSSH